MGPTLSFRGLDNANYYRLVDDDQAHYFDTTGTGNSLLMRSPHVLQLIMDSLRYWVLEMHVDGFRFDLAATLARQFHEVDRLSAFFDLVHQDPVVSQVKLIAEPWDVGDGGYQVGGFPPLWSEWNGKYRDTVRDFWRGEPSTLGEFASRLSGSSDLYEHTGRRPIASVNFVTAHDGFTLNDLVSYNEKHNEANGEDNNDGESHNRSWNCGVEGPTDDAVDQRAARAPAAELPHHAAALAGRADDRPRRRAGPHPAGQQQRVLPGRPDLVDRLGPRPGRDRPAGVHASPGAAAPGPPRVPAPPLLRRRARPRRTSPTSSTWPGSRRTATTCATRPGAPTTRAPYGVPQRRRDRRAGPARPGDRRRQLPGAVQRPARRRRVHAPAQPVRGRLDGGRGHRLADRGRQHGRRRARPSSSARSRSSSSRGPRSCRPRRRRASARSRRRRARRPSR